jgi:hypothetical protein
MSTTEEFDAAVRRHDSRLAALALTVWVGSEPTFTDRSAQTPEWLNAAVGGAKEQRAQALLGGLCQRFPGGLVLRSVGRQYPGETQRRWNLGLYRRRDGVAIWHGPVDPILAAPAAAAEMEPLSEPELTAGLGAWAAAVCAAFEARGFQVTPLSAQSSLERRIVVRVDADVELPDAADPRLARPSVHEEASPTGGLRDELAQAGVYLFVLQMADALGRLAPRIELPQIPAVPLFLALLEDLEQASLACGLPTLRVAGYLPPVDASVELTTVTPDPAVVEINTAPECRRPGLPAAQPRDLRRCRGPGPGQLPALLQRHGGRFRRRRPDHPGGPVAARPAPSCASRTCCRAWCATSTAIRRCPTSSRTTSWAAAASRCAPTSVAPMPSTNWRSPWPCWRAKPTCRLNCSGTAWRRSCATQPATATGRDQHRKALEPLPGRPRQAGPGGVPRPCACSTRRSGPRRWPACCAAWWRCWPAPTMPCR